jgi:hypothetical protein
MNNDFIQIQQCLYQINKDLVIVLPDQLMLNEFELMPQLLLQISIYGSKLIELYQTLDELCPTDRMKHDICKFQSSEDNVPEVSVLKVIQAQMVSYSDDIHDLQDRLKRQNDAFEQNYQRWQEERGQLQEELVAVKMQRLNGENDYQRKRNTYAMAFNRAGS